MIIIIFIKQTININVIIITAAGRAAADGSIPAARRRAPPPGGGGPGLGPSTDVVYYYITL